MYFLRARSKQSSILHFFSAVKVLSSEVRTDVILARSKTRLYTSDFFSAVKLFSSDMRTEKFLKIC